MKLKLTLFCFICFVVLMTCKSVFALPLTYDFSGAIEYSNSQSTTVTEGDTFSGSFSFDSEPIPTGLINEGREFIENYFSNMNVTIETSNGPDVSFNFDSNMTAWLQDDIGSSNPGYEGDLFVLVAPSDQLPTPISFMTIQFSSLGMGPGYDPTNIYNPLNLEAFDNAAFGFLESTSTQDLLISSIGRIDQLSLQTAPVPEPATMLLFGTGLVGLVGSRLRKKKK